MKYLFALLPAAFLCLAAFIPVETTVLTGKVTDDAGEPLIGATVKVMKGAELIRGTITDYEGTYRLSLDPGTYAVEFSYTGFESHRILDVKVVADQLNTLDVQLKSGAILSEVVITNYKVPLIKQDEISSGMVLTSEEIRRMPTRSVKAVEAKTAGAPAADKRDVKVKGARSETAAYYIDGIRVAGEVPPPPPSPVESKALALEDMTIKEKGESWGDPDADTPGIPDQPAPRAGLLTAGEWNDLDNWGKHWTDLLKDGEIDEYQKMYGFYPRTHYTVLLSNEQDIPLVDVPVTLYDRFGTAVWQSRTDNTGKAELWADLFAAKSDKALHVAVATVDGVNKPLGNLKPAEEGLNRVTITRPCGHSNNVDIVWTVDATGSMGDELEYLKTELLDVIGRVQATNPDLSIRMGTVFYRDQGDDYVVKSSALNHDISKTVDYIRRQSAGGGGDYPEAVHSALEEAIYRQPWSSEAVTRICFLVLDASPHQNPEVLAGLQKSIRDAAQKGIRIVPVSASGIQKDTEFLMKFFGLATNGTYVFLTDHSGIGGKHIEPTTDEYKVELLNDLLVRLITQYSTVESCEGKVAIRFDDPQQQPGQAASNLQALYYPNPAVSQFTLELPFDAQKVTLYDAEGKAVRQLNKLTAGTHPIPVNDLPPGFYTLRIWKDRQVQSGKVLVVRA